MNSLTINHATLVTHQNRLKLIVGLIVRGDDHGAAMQMRRAVEEIDEWLTDPTKQVKK